MNFRQTFRPPPEPFPRRLLAIDVAEHHALSGTGEIAGEVRRKGRFPGRVVADEGDDLVTMNGEINADEGLDAAEPLRQPLNLEERVARIDHESSSEAVV